MLKSAELTGIWERKLRQIEKGEYDPRQFIEELKEMLTGIVTNVKNEWGSSITIVDAVKEEAVKSKKKAPKEKKPSEKKKAEKAIKEKTTVSLVCPLCKKGTILKGKSAYGCSEWKAGCTFRLSFDEVGGENLTDEELSKILNK